MIDLQQKIMSAVDQDLLDIETAITENLNPNLELVSDVAGHILFSGGKRLRPLLMVLSTRICGYKGDYDKIFSAAIEYLHAATLLHDDLIDGATLRRNKQVAHLKWDNAIAVLVGDFLLARALSIAAATGLMKIVEILASLTELMSQGEIHQLLSKRNIDLSEKEYLEVIRRKTALLFEAACRVSAILAEASQEHEKALSDYGYNLGIAFQMADDLFDYTLETAAFGKEVGADLREGKMTLPLIHAFKQANAADREQIIRMVHRDDFTVREFKELVELLRRYDALMYTETLAGSYIEKAKAALHVFSASATKDTLLDLADYALRRHH